MKISKAISQLQKLKRQNGDLDLVSLSVSENGFWLEDERIFEVVRPDSYDHYICAYMEKIDWEDAKPELRLIKS